jgi:hypothetical protein
MACRQFQRRPAPARVPVCCLLPKARPIELPNRGRTIQLLEALASSFVVSSVVFGSFRKRCRLPRPKGEILLYPSTQRRDEELRPTDLLVHDFSKQVTVKALICARKSICDEWTNLSCSSRRHREDEAMLNDGILRGGRIFPDGLEPRLRNAPLRWLLVS